MTSLALPASAIEEGARMPAEAPTETDWAALRVFSAYRIALVGALLFSHAVFGSLLGFTGPGPERVLPILGGYGAAALLLALLAMARAAPLVLQVSAGVLVDVLVIVLLQHFSVARLELDLLLPISVAAAALIARGRLAFFQAALASIGLLAEQGLRVLRLDSPASDFALVGLVSAGCFATAGLAWALARYARASEALARERAREVEELSRVNDRVVQAMQQGLLVVDAEGAVRTRNPAAERLLGLPPARVKPALREAAPDVAALLASWREREDAPSVATLPSTAVRPELAVTFLSTGLRRDRASVVMVEDVGRAREQARQAKLASLGRLTASIAHEIRNPLSSINQAAELLAEGESMAPAQARMAAIIRDNVSRLDRIVTEVLDLNRRVRPEPESLDVRATLGQFVAGFCAGERVPVDGLRLEAPEGLRALADRQHLERALWNLCRNAWRHGSRRAGSVRVAASAGRLPGTIALEVSDDGPGLTEEARAHLFEPFFTTDASGLGLGLYIARELCVGNGGSLEALEGAGGACFRITVREA